MPWPVGVGLGIVEGEVDWIKEDSTVGGGDGTPEGIAVRANVISAVGTGVGLAVSPAVGRRVRDQEGRLLGRMDGSLLGPVGATVGAGDGSPWHEMPT